MNTRITECVCVYMYIYLYVYVDILLNTHTLYVCVRNFRVRFVSG